MASKTRLVRVGIQYFISYLTLKSRLKVVQMSINTLSTNQSDKRTQERVELSIIFLPILVQKFLKLCSHALQKL